MQEQMSVIKSFCEGGYCLTFTDNLHFKKWHKPSGYKRKNMGLTNFFNPTDFYEIIDEIET